MSVAGRAPLTGIGLIMGAHLRSGWRGLVLWTLALVAMVLLTAWSIKALYPTLEARLIYAQSVGSSPAVAAFNGRAYDLATLGGIAAYEVGFLGMLAVPIVLGHLAIRLTRHEEDAGRTELIRSGRVGRLAPISAAGVVLTAVTIVFVAATGAGMAALGYPAGGSWSYALVIGAFGFAFAALALLAAEVSNEARTAYGLTMLVVLLAFLARALIDGRGWAATWASPMGWIAEARPWGEGRWWPVVAFAALAVAALTAATWATLHRDLGSGVVRTGRGPAEGAHALGTPMGFAWRFTRAAAVGWLVGLVVWGLAIGSLSSEMTDLVAQNPAITEMLGIDRPEQLITVMAVLLSALGSASLAVQGIGRLAREEEAGRIGLTLSTRVGRGRLWATWVVVVAAEVVTVLVASSAATGLSTWAATGERSTLPVSVGAGFALVPAVLLVLAVSALLHAVTPRLVPLAWLLVGWATVVGLLGETLRLPEWSREVSPLYATGNVPIEPASRAVLVGLTLAAVLLVAAGVRRFARRDLTAG